MESVLLKYHKDGIWEEIVLSSVIQSDGFSLEDRICRAMGSSKFIETLEANGSDLVDFQINWAYEAKGDFNNLRSVYQKAILEAEANENLSSC